MGSFQKGFSLKQFSVILENIQININKQKERLRDTHLRQKIINKEIVELDQSLIEAVRETKSIDNENMLIKLNNTIGNLQSSAAALSFNQLAAFQCKKQHEGIKRTVSDPTNTSQIEGVE